jgi:PAS domain S-box-containing protein
MASTSAPLNGRPPDPRDPASVGEIALVLLESMSDAVYAVDGDWRITFANPAFSRHMSMPQGQLIGRILWDVINAENRPRLELAYVRVRDSGLAEAFIQESVIYPGRWIDVRVAPVPGGLAVTFRDITRRVNAERALATSEEHLRRALDGAAMGDWSWNAETDAMTLSRRALALYGLGPEVQGMTRDALRRTMIHPDDLSTVRAAAARAHAEQGQYDVDYRVRRDSGWRWMRVMGAQHVVEGRTIGMHGLVQDIHELKLANERLQAEVEERERGQQRQLLLIHELNHRVKNILAMVQAIAMQTLSAATSPGAARESLELRLVALAQAHDVLTRESWDGAELSDIIAAALAPHQTPAGRRFRVDGPQVRLEPKTAVSLAMALHELATNAVKYGALSVAGGWVAIGWTAEPAPDGVALRLDWAEHDGPPVRPPTHRGFGTRLIARSLAAEGGTCELAYPSQGARCRIAVVLPLAGGATDNWVI